MWGSRYWASATAISFSPIWAAEIKEAGYKGIVLTGGPNSVYEENAAVCDKGVFRLGIPVLGICYGAQLMAHLFGGLITSAENSSEYGKTTVFSEESVLFEGVPRESICWMSHTDYVKELPKEFINLAHSAKCPVAAYGSDEKKLYGVQFHPEVSHTVYGQDILRNFIFRICGCKADWKIEDFAKESILKYSEELKGKKVLLALSGGVDSSVAAVLLHKAVGSNLTCVFVDHGLLRKGEGDYVEHIFKERFKMNFVRVNAKERFLEKLKGVTDPEQKRKIIGEEFIRVFEDEAKKLGEIHVLAQGTIYPDVVESGSGSSATIKSHHNVGGLPELMNFERIVEPLRYLFKDEVRETGLKLGLPADMVYRQPFPGPGLAVRITGEVTDEKLEILKEADAIFREEMKRLGCDRMSNQYFAVLTNTRAVGVIGDFRSYGYTVVLRAVSTDDFMTAEWTRLPYEVLESSSSRITNEIRAVSRVTYDITSKPPATVEFE
ncbi:MAG: glutamine-hydrolyzing GMP synthase [Firmicutes bacterium]|nr:glutamine-hydrolyzing GMP synthase [Bacillota bacterium]